MTGWLADTSARYVDRLRDLARHLDTAIRRQADGIPAEHWPQLHDPSRWLRPDFHDLKAACDQAGEAGDAIFLAAVRVFDDVSKVVADYRGSGSVEAWVSCRVRVLEDLDAISEAGGARPAAEVCRSAAPAAVPSIVLTTWERDMLKTLRDNDATSDADGVRLKKEDVEGFGGMKPHQVRKAAKSLLEKGLVASFPDRRGGYWLTPKGIEVAHGL